MSVFVSILRPGTPDPEFADLPELAEPEPISWDEIIAAAKRAPHFKVPARDDGGSVELPIGRDESIRLSYCGDPGLLNFQLLAGHAGKNDAILIAMRRFAGCIPGAVVEAEGERFEAIPWDARQAGDAR